MSKRFAGIMVIAVMAFLPAMAWAGFFDSMKKAAGMASEEKVPMGLKDICPSLASYEGTAYDPYKDTKKEFTKLNIPQVDDFNLNMFKLSNTLEAATSITNATKEEVAKNPTDTTAITACITDLTAVLTNLGAQVPAIISSGQNLGTNLPSILAGPNAVKIKEITQSITNSIEELKTIPDKAKNLVAELAELSKVMTENAQKAAEGAVDQAKDAAAAAQDQAAGAVEQAKDAAAAAQDQAAGAVEQAKDAAAEGMEKAKDAAAEAKDAAAEGAAKAEEGAAKAEEATKTE